MVSEEKLITNLNRFTVFFLNSKFSILLQRNRTLNPACELGFQPDGHFIQSLLTGEPTFSTTGLFRLYIIFSFQQKVIEGPYNVSCHADMLTIASLALPPAASLTYTHNSPISKLKSRKKKFQPTLRPSFLSPFPRQLVEFCNIKCRLISVLKCEC